MMNKELKKVIEKVRRANLLSVSVGRSAEQFYHFFDNELLWDKISRMPLLSISFLKQFKDKINWFWFTLYLNNDEVNENYIEQIIKEFHDYVDWEVVSYAIPIPEYLLYKYQHKIQWKEFGWLERKKSLSLSFFYNFRDKIDFESFIEQKGISIEQIKKWEQKDKAEKKKRESPEYRYTLMDIR